MSLLERIYHFHGELKRGRYPNTRTLMDQFEISLATARRDISYLRDRLLAPIAFDQVQNGFYYTEEGFGLPFEQSPKVVFFLAILSKIAEEAGLGALPEVQALEKRLAEMVLPEYSRLIEAIHCEWVEVEEIDPAIFETIMEATVTGRLLRIGYRSATGEVSRRELEPLRLLSYQGRWYALAFCRLRQDIRLFHIARIGEAELLRTSFQRRAADNLESYLASAFGIFKGAPRYHAVIRFTGTAAELVRHQRWHRDQRIEEDGQGVLLHLPVRDDRELIMKVLQYGAKARVVAPAELVEKVAAEARAMTRLYD